jgi:hypothetical protein
MTVVRKIGVAVLAAVAAGVLLGAVARLMMRLATVAAGHESDFSLGGSLSIMVIFVVFATPGAILASLMRRRGRSTLLVIGALVLCLPAASVASQDLGDLGGLSGLEWVGVGMATAGVFAAILALPPVTLLLLRVSDRQIAFGRSAVSPAS